MLSEVLAALFGCHHKLLLDDMRGSRAQTYSVSGFAGFPQRTTAFERNAVGGIQGGMSPWSQDGCPRRGGRERSDRWKGEGEALSPPRRLGKAKS